MQNQENDAITVSALKTYLNSLEAEEKQAKALKVREYKIKCEEEEVKPKKKRIEKIEKQVAEEYDVMFDAKDEILELIDECKDIPSDIDKLKVAEYMLYRADSRKAEKIIHKIIKQLEKRYQDIQEQVEDAITEFPALDEIESIDYKEFNVKGDILAKSKEKYKLELAEDERKGLIQKELDIVEKAQKFNSIPIPHEILKTSDKDIQSKMQKFNNIRQKKLRILESMKQNYETLIYPREMLCMIDDAIENIEENQNILTASEYKSVKKILIKKRKKIFRSTNDIRALIRTKEKKTGIENFYIQEARYLRMEKLRNDILSATTLIKQHPTDGLEAQLEKLKISYDREKQFASVIEKLDDSNSDETIKAEVKVYEEQINSLQDKIQKYKKISSEQQDIVKKAKKELITLWKMEINCTISKKKESFELPEKTAIQETKDTSNLEETEERKRNTFEKLKRLSKGKHACT